MEVGKIIGIMSFFGSTTIIMLYVNASDLLKNKKILKNKELIVEFFHLLKLQTTGSIPPPPVTEKLTLMSFHFLRTNFPFFFCFAFAYHRHHQQQASVLPTGAHKKNFWCDCCRKSVTKASHEAKRKNKNFLMLQSGCALRERKQLTVFNVQFITSW